jgi:WD40 repeat protein
MYQYSLTQLLMALSFVAISLGLFSSRGCEPLVTRVKCLEFSPDGRELLVVRTDERDIFQSRSRSPRVSRTISVFDANRGLLTRIVERVWSPAISACEMRVAATFGADPGTFLIRDLESADIRLYDRATQHCHKIIAGYASGHSEMLAFSRDHAILATGAQTEVLLWNARLGSKLQAINIRRPYPCTRDPIVSFSGDGELLASAAFGGVDIWTIRDGRRVGFIKTSSNGAALEWFGFSLDRRALAIPCDSGIELVDLGGKERRLLRCPATALGQFFPNTKKLLAVTEDGDEAFVVDVDTGETQDRLPLNLPTAIAVSPDGARVAIGDIYGCVTLWELPSHGHSHTFEAPGAAGNSLWPQFVVLVLWAIAAVFVALRRKRRDCTGARIKSDKGTVAYTE